MKILSVFTHTHVVPNLYGFICCVFLCVFNPKEDIWKNVLIKQIAFPIDYIVYIFSYYGSQWGMRSV